MKKILICTCLFILCISSAFAANISNVMILDDAKDYLTINSFDDDSTLGELKKYIETQTQIDSSIIKLYLSDTLLEGENTSLSNLGIVSDSKLNLKLDKYDMLENLNHNLEYQIQSIFVDDANNDLYYFMGNNIYKNDNLIINNTSTASLNIYVNEDGIFLQESSQICKYDLNTYALLETINNEDIKSTLTSICSMVKLNNGTYAYLLADNNKLYLKLGENEAVELEPLEAPLINKLLYDKSKNILYYTNETSIKKLDLQTFTPTVVYKAEDTIIDVVLGESDNFYISFLNNPNKLFNTKTNTYTKLIEKDSIHNDVEIMKLASSTNGIYFSKFNLNNYIYGIKPFNLINHTVNLGDISITGDMLSTTKFEVSNIGTAKKISASRINKDAYVKLTNLTLTFNNLENNKFVKITGEGIDSVVEVKNNKASIAIEKIGTYDVKYVEPQKIISTNPKTGYSKYILNSIILLISSIIVCIYTLKINK